ncbi:MAG: hypothetical protein KAH57_02925 [Thermoplasmata archaeon]|nr:hypothetical protein [Thermoplasmata archaeon]
MDELKDQVSKENRKWMIPLIVLLLILAGVVSYQWLIPRTDLEVRTVYHEATGGGGTGGLIHVNILLTNWGNREINDLYCRYTVNIVNGSEMAHHESSSMVLQRKDNAELKLDFVGSQYWDYLIEIEISFMGSSGRISKDLSYYTFEETMNIVFIERIG